MCMAKSCPPQISADCDRLLREVDSAMPTMVFAARDPAGRDIAGVSVTMDGKPFIAMLEGKAVSVDPGQHRFLFSAPGYAPLETSMVVLESQKDRLALVVLTATTPAVPAASSASTPTAPSGPGVPGGAAAPGPIAGVEGTSLAPYAAPTSAETVGRPTPAPSSAGPSARQTVGLVVGGVGIAGLLVGTVSGIMALSKGSTLHDECPGGNSACPPSAQSDINGLNSAATIADVGIGVGLVGLGIGAVLWSLPSHDGTQAARTITPWVGVGGSGIAGTF